MRRIINAQCPMPNAQYFGFAQYKCPMPNAQCPINNKQKGLLN
ncbi:hypothetical protein [Nostoc sp.]